MENPFESIDKKLDKIILLLQQLVPDNGAILETAPKDTMTIKEAAQFLGVSKQSIYHHTMTRSIPHYKIGKKLYFLKPELDSWIQKHRVKTQAELVEEANTYLAKRRR
jgi:excisionase family DNA binding protein